MKERIVGYHTIVLIHCSQIATIAHFSPKAIFTQWYTPPLSGKAAESSVATSEVGIKKTSAEKMKKKINALPNSAEAGKLRMLSIAATIKRTKENNGSFFGIKYGNYFLTMKAKMSMGKYF